MTDEQTPKTKAKRVRKARMYYVLPEGFVQQSAIATGKSLRDVRKAELPEGVNLIEVAQIGTAFSVVHEVKNRRVVAGNK